MAKTNKQNSTDVYSDEMVELYEQSPTTPNEFGYQSGTETNPQNSPFQANVYSFITNSIQNIVETHIASLKSNVAAYKKECKEYQSQMHDTDKELANLKGQFFIIKILASICFTALVGNLICTPIYFAKVIYPEIQQLKTEIALLKNEKKSTPSQTNTKH